MQIKSSETYISAPANLLGDPKSANLGFVAVKTLNSDVAYN